MSEHQNHPDDQVLLGWHAHKWVDHEKGKGWWTAAATLTITIIMLSLIKEDYTLTFLVAIGSGVYYLLSSQEAPVVPVTITEFGIHFDDRFWQYSQIKQFWIIYNPPHVATLHLEIIGGGLVDKEIIIQLEDVHPINVRETLSQQIPEAEGKQERFTHALARLVRF